MIKRASLASLAFAAAACATAPNPNIIPVGSTAVADLDTCINNAFTSMEGRWHMRFSLSGPDGKVAHSDGHLAIAVIDDNRWIIQRPGPSGEYENYSEITNYGDGLLESHFIKNPDSVIWTETYLECYSPDASGRFKYVSTLTQSVAGGEDLNVTRTGWGSADYHYSIDVMQGETTYALRTRSGVRED